MTDIIYKANDNLIEAIGVKNAASGEFINDASAEVTLVDESDVEVVGDTWPKTLNYVSGSNGDYRATLIDTLTLNADSRYTAKLTVDGGPGLMSRFELPLWCQIRTDI